jgi:sugar (pentulose or hexulose) kinase
VSEGPGAAGAPLVLVVDVGKTRSKLVVLDRGGAVLAQADRANPLVDGGDYAALDSAGIARWIEASLADLGALRARLAHAVVSAHGAAFAAIDGDALALPIPDYEFTGFDERSPDWATQVGDFDDTLSPDLPRGLNGATQLDWLERHRGSDFARGVLVPYAQYWAWWLSGVAASEVSALGCHTHLWSPLRGDWSLLAQRRGWQRRFAPLRRAWEVLGPVRPALAQRLGLPAELRVHTGVHDSNACLARYLRSHPRMTLVTTGTWIVVMAPGAPPRKLDATQDLLGNVSVRNERVPTGRFMGGRELQHLCVGADPALANVATLAALIARGVMALPGFETQGGPFRTRTGCVVDAEGALVELATLEPAERATLATTYAAQVTVWLIERLGGTAPVIVEGPFAHNPMYTRVLAALLPREPVHVSSDGLEGTARGAWMLSHWTEPGIDEPMTTVVAPVAIDGLAALHARWLARCGGETIGTSP